MSKSKLYKKDVQAGSMFDLPIDSSLNRLAKEAERECADTPISRTMIRSALQDLESVDTDSSESLYSKIIYGREDENKLLTASVAIYWETQEFVKAIAKARHYNRGVKGDALAERTFWQIANGLSSCDLSQYKGNFVELQFLRSEVIRNILTRAFDEEIYKRLTVIWEFSVLQPGDYAAKNLRIVTQRLDDLIIDLWQNIAPDDYVWPVANIDSLNELYENLTHERMEMLRINETRDKSDYKKIEFSGLASKSNKRIINKLYGVLRNHDKRLTPHKKRGVAKKYNRYLLFKTKIAQDEYLRLDSFVDQLNSLHSYFSTITDINGLRSQVQDELCLFANQIFEDLTHNELILYPYASAQFDRAQSSFLNERLKNARSQILMKIHNGLSLLRTVNILLFFGVNDIVLPILNLTNSAQKTNSHFMQLADLIEGEIKGLITTQLDLPYCDPTPESINAFISIYHEHTKDIFKEETPSGHELYGRIENLSIAPLCSRVYGYAAILNMICKLVVAKEVSTTVDEIMEQYSALSELFALYHKNENQ